MFDVWFANPFISFVMFEKNSLVAPVPTDVTDVFLISDIELVEIWFTDGFMGLSSSSSKLSCSLLKEVDSLSNPTYQKM